MSSCLGVKHLDTDFTDQGKAREQIDLACEVLKTFFKVQDPAAILSQYGISMLRALNHPNVEVKELVLQELNRAASEPMLTPRLCEERDLLLCVVTCVGHEDNSVARPSVQFLVKLGSTLEGTKSLFSTSMLETLNRVAQLNDINRFRVYEAQKNDKDWTVQKRLLSASRASQMAVFDNEIERWGEVDLPSQLIESNSNDKTVQNDYPTTLGVRHRSRHKELVHLPCLCYSVVADSPLTRLYY
ncbi:26S proteasome non-ATPase regulatory subunit 5 [Homalodisca vitripennis]|nr:26S proteasome non-ATPase regulatory subunit 5 [Homalodisca vitripennis]